MRENGSVPPEELPVLAAVHRRCIVVTLLALASSAPHAQSGGTFRISQSLVASGGGVASGAGWRLEGTVALVCAGPVPSGQMAGGSLRLRGGFWPEDDVAAGDVLLADGFE